MMRRLVEAQEKTIHSEIETGSVFGFHALIRWLISLYIGCCISLVLNFLSFFSSGSNKVEYLPNFFFQRLRHLVCFVFLEIPWVSFL